jgi:hypothetical protein
MPATNSGRAEPVRPAGAKELILRDFSFTIARFFASAIEIRLAVHSGEK